jgi:hypothetical protein
MPAQIQYQAVALAGFERQRDGDVESAAPVGSHSSTAPILGIPPGFAVADPLRLQAYSWMPTAESVAIFIKKYRLAYNG